MKREIAELLDLMVDAAVLQLKTNNERDSTCEQVHMEDIHQTSIGLRPSKTSFETATRLRRGKT